MTLPISAATWARLVKANQAAVLAGWAQPGIFGTGIGPGYEKGGPNSILYVGKSAGPLGASVGSVYEQEASARASTDWMVRRLNKSAFWQLIDKFDRTRLSLAWSNLSKMDRIGGGVPPKLSEWMSIRDECTAALSEEILSLEPRVVLFGTSDYLREDVERFAISLAYRPDTVPFEDGWTKRWSRSNGQFFITTKHPQGWSSAARDNVVAYIKSLLI